MHSGSASSSRRSSPCPPSPISQRKQNAKAHSILPVLSLLILSHLAHVLYTLPLNRLIERRICDEYYAKHVHTSPNESQGAAVPEERCKIDDVQRQLAFLLGVLESIGVVCDVLVTIPYGFVAEKYGLRTVLWSGLLGQVFTSVWALCVGYFTYTLPTDAIVAGGFFALLGGGECVFQSAILTLTSTLSQSYVRRASHFSFTSSTTYVISFLGPSIAAFTMSKSIWLPFWLNVTLLSTAVPIIAYLPQTRGGAIASLLASEDSQDGLNEARPLLATEEPRIESVADASKTNASMTREIKRAFRKIRNVVIGCRNFQIILCSVFFTSLASSNSRLLVQYISKRYRWTFAQAGYMLSAKAIVNFFLLAFVIPRLIRISLSSSTFHGSEIRLNYVGAQASIIASIIGVLCVALAFKFWLLLAALAIYALGSALPVFIMPLIKSPLIAKSDGEVQHFSIMMLAKTMGSLVGTPGMTVLWVQGIKRGGGWLGLPYFASTIAYAAASVAVTKLQF